jgi:HK97 family phage major capsid protein
MKLTKSDFIKSILPGLRAQFPDRAALTTGVNAFLGANEITDDDGHTIECKALDVGVEPEPEPVQVKRTTTEPTFTAEQMQAIIAAEVQKAISRDPKPAPRKNVTIEVDEPEILKDKSRGFKSMGHFANDVVQACRPGGAPSPVFKRYSDALETKAISGMGQTIGSEGGFLVPPEYSQMIWDGLHKEPDSLLPKTDNYTVTGESITFNGNAETSRATGSRYGGIRGYWIAEAGQITSSKPKFRQVKIEPKQLAVMVYVTDKLLNNAGPSLSQYLTKAATEEIGFLTNDAVINGAGAGQPLGLLNSITADTALGTPGTVVVGPTIGVYKETGQAGKTIVKANIDNMYARLHPKARAGAVWYINQDTLPQLEALSAVVGVGGVPVYLPPGGYTEAPNARLKGLPVIPIEYAATLGTVGDIILANLSYYVTGTRGTIDSAISIHLRFDYAESVFRFMWEVDGQPWLFSPITPYKGTMTLSPFIALNTRA